MYKSKYNKLINHLTNELDLILLDSEIINIERIVDDYITSPIQNNES